MTITGQCLNCKCHGILDEDGNCADCVGIIPMDHIGKKTVQIIRQLVGDLAEDNRTRINQAYLQNDDLKIAFAVKLAPGKNPGDVHVDVQMSFTPEKVKEEAGGMVNERQPGLPGLGD